MWAKFFGWAAIASVSTLTRARSGLISAAGAAGAFIDAAVNECQAVASAEGYAQPEANLEICRNLFAQAGDTYAPSILVDMERGRRTEGEHLIGDMWRRGREQGLDVPLLTAALCNLQCHELKVAQG